MYSQSKILTPGNHEIKSFEADFHFDETTTSLSQPLSFSMTTDGGVVVFQYDEPNPPFHLMVGMESKLVVMKMQENASKRDRDVFEETTNETMIFLPCEPPFLGFSDDKESQMALINSLFRVPLFSQPPNRWDFILYEGTIQPISAFFLCGQMEPQHICVPQPLKNKNGALLVMRSQEMLLALGISFLLKEASCPLSMKYIRNSVLSSYSLNSPERKNIRLKCEELIQRIGRRVDKGYSKQLGKYVLRTKTLPPYFQLESLFENIIPELVCAEQSSLSAEYRLRQLGITCYPSLDQITAWLSLMNKLRNFKETRLETLVDQKPNDHVLVKYLVLDIVKLDQRLKIGRFILDELIRAPWNTTSTFFVSHVEPDNKGMPEIDYFKDQFSYVRFINNQNNAKNEKMVADMRKLKMNDAIQLLTSGFHVSKEEMDVLLQGKHKRHDLNERVKTLCAASTEVFDENNPLKRFVRGGPVSPRSYISKCKSIWKSQKDRLTRIRPLLEMEKEEEDTDDEDEDTEAATVAILNNLKNQPVNEERTFQSLLTMMQNPFPQVADPPPSSQVAVADPSLADPSLDDPPPSPQQVVRRTVRTVHEDGTETIHFQFLFCDQLLKRVLKLEKQPKK